MANLTHVRPFGMRDKIAYAFGDVANDCTFILSSTFLMKFYINVMGVESWIVGLMMMVDRIVDAFTDMTMGRIVDLSKPTKAGKFRPWILRGSGLVAVASFLMYAIWLKDAAMPVKLVWMFVTYLLWGSVFYTMVNIPYGSMASAITSDPTQRTQLSVYRNAGATVDGLIIGAGIPTVVYNADGSLSGEKFAVMAAVMSVLAVVCYLICYFGSCERVKFERPEKKADAPKGNFLKNLVTNRALLAIILAAICLLLSQLTLNGMAQYVFPDYYHSPDAVSLSSLLGNLAILALAFVATPLSKRYGKKEISIVGMLLSTVSLAVCFLLRTENVWVFTAFYVITYLGLGVFNTVIWACIVDVIDYGEVKNGVREDGTTYACYSFARKLGQAASSGLTGGLLSLVGYTELTRTDPAVLDGVFNITCVVPIVGFLLVALVLIFLYPLSKKVVEANSAELASRRAQ